MAVLVHSLKEAAHLNGCVGYLEHEVGKTQAGEKVFLVRLKDYSNPVGQLRQLREQNLLTDQTGAYCVENKWDLRSFFDTVGCRCAKNPTIATSMS
jgi:hypothetical protein